MRLNDHAVVITGAGGGIGRAAAVAFAADGAAVIAADLADKADAVAEGIRRAGGRVVGLTRAIASELGSQGFPGITVNAICPGYVRAGMGVAMQATKAGPMSGVEIFERYYKRLVPQRRMIEAEEIAHAAVFLALPESAGMTGQALNVDGGFFMS